MPTEEIRFGGPTSKRAIAEADGRHPSSNPLILRDRGFEGLTIRVTGRTAAWYLRYKKVFHRLAPVGSPDVKAASREKGVLYTASDASGLADRLREVIDRGHDPKAYVAAWAQSGTHESAAVAADTVVARAAGAWTWEELVDRYIKHKVGADKVLQHAVKPASAASVADVADTLRHKDLDVLKPKLARNLSRRDIESIRDAWYDAGRMGAQRKIITYTKSAMKWAKAHFAESGLSDIAPWWSEMKHRAYASKVAIAKAKGEKVAPTLTPADVARLLFIAEQDRFAVDKETSQRTGDTTLAFLWWVCLAAQRTHAAAAVRLSMIVDRTTTDGWIEVSWLPADVKSKRPHVLPIPPEVYRRTIGRALAAPNRREDTIWAFPTNRVIKKEKGDLDRPVGDWILNNLLARLRGERDGGPDLLADLPEFTPHSIRKALTTFLADQPLPPGTASAILDHAARKTEGEDEAAVTSRHYNQSLRLPLKFAGLTKWSDEVIKEYDLLRVAERDKVFGLLLSGSRRRATIDSLKPHELWLFDRHLPPAPASEPSTPGPLDMSKLRVIEDPNAEREPDDYDLKDVG